MEQSIQQLQFLDFEDVDTNEVEYIQSVLYSLRSPRLELPWVEHVDVPNTHWNQHQQYEGSTDCGEGGGEVYPVQVPVATTIQQVYHQVVPSIPSLTAFVSNLTANVNVHGYMQSTIPYHPVYQQDNQDQRGPQHNTTRRQRSSKPSPKRNEQRRGGEPPASFPQPLPPQYTPQPAPYPIHVPLPPAPYQYIPQAPHIPSAQHATGPPLYLTPTAAISMYPTPHHLYGQYQPAVFSPHLQQPPEELKHPPQPENFEKQNSFEKKEERFGNEHKIPVRKTVEFEEKGQFENKEQPYEEGRETVSESSITSNNVESELTRNNEPSETHKNSVEVVQPSLPQPVPVSIPSAIPAIVPVPTPVSAHTPTPTPSHTPIVTPTNTPVVMSAPPLAPVPTPIPVSAPAPAHSSTQEVVSETQSTPPVEKPVAKSLPINAIKTTSLPSLPAVKRKPQLGEEPLPVIVTPVSGKTWAGLFKDRSSEETMSPPTEKPLVRKPPINAVAVTPPPRCDPVIVENSSQQPLPPRVAKPSLVPQTNTPHKQPLVKNSPAHPVSDVAEDPVLRRIGEALSQYQLEHKAIVLTPRGLTNPSNYCYINATLQALLACPPFYNLIKTIAQHKQNSHPGSKLRTPVIDSMIQFIKEFSPAPITRLGRREKAQARKDDCPFLDIPTGPAFEPSYVYKMLLTLRNDNSFQVEGRQEDAEEFLSLLLNGLHDEMLELTKLVGDSKGTALSNGDVTNGDSHQDDNSDWKEVTTKGMRITRRAEFGRTPLSDIFMGQLRCSVHRGTGASEPSTDNVQPFFTLQLDIETSESVNEALEKLVGWDHVEGVSSDQTDTWQQQSLDSLPYVLILHLKCFHYRQQTCSKIMKTLDFPVDLRLEPKLLSNKIKSGPKTRQYKLFAVVYHDGKEASKGHYLSDVFHVGTGGWIRYDDATVQSVTEHQVLHPRSPRVPYLLYYRRADTIGAQSVQSR